jgi:hypothetical protein
VITGTTMISDIARSYIGRRVTLLFAAACTVNHGTSILLAGSANKTFNANDTLTLVCHTVNFWAEIARREI